MIKWTNSLNYSLGLLWWYFICWSLGASGLTSDSLFLKKLYCLNYVFHKDVESNVRATNSIPYFSMFFPTKANVKFSNGNMVNSQVIGIFYVFLKHLPLYILRGTFVTFQVTLTIPYHWVTLNVMLVFKMIRLNLLNIVILCTLKIVCGGHPIGTRKFWTIFILGL